MVWIPVAKPTSSLITKVNPPGKENYDDQLVSYDDPNTFYDGINPLQWTAVSKPVGPAWTKVNKPV